MRDLETELVMVDMDYREVGALIGKFAIWKRTATQLAIIIRGQEPQIVPSADLTMDETGIMLRGKMLVPLKGLNEIRQSTSCVDFRYRSGKEDVEGMIAPATRPEGHDPSAEIRSFYEDWFGDDEHVYLSDIDGPTGGWATENKLDVRPGAGSAGTCGDGDIFVVNGTDIAIGDVAWAECDDDGDGNRYLHLVLTGGRYRRIVCGDLGR